MARKPKKKSSPSPLEYELALEDGEEIVREGTRGRDMFIIQEGEVTISRTVGDRELVLANLGRGSFFGEMSLLEGLPRSATVRARGATRLLVLRRGALLFKIRRDPTFALEMLHAMSRRLRYLDERITELVSSGSVSSERMMETLAAVEVEALKERSEPQE